MQQDPEIPGELRQQFCFGCFGLGNFSSSILQMARESETKEPPFHIEEFNLDHLDTADADCSWSCLLLWRGMRGATIATKEHFL